MHADSRLSTTFLWLANTLVSTAIYGVLLTVGLILSVFALLASRLWSTLSARLSSTAMLQRMLIGHGDIRRMNRCWLVATATGTLGLIPLLMLLWTTNGSSGDSTSVRGATQSSPRRQHTTSSTAAGKNLSRPLPSSAEPIEANRPPSLLIGSRDVVSQTGIEHRSRSTHATKVQESSANTERVPVAVHPGSLSQLDLEIILGQVADAGVAIDGPTATASEPVWFQQPPATDSIWTVWLPPETAQPRSADAIPGAPRRPTIWHVDNTETAQLVQVELRSIVRDRTPIGNRFPVEILATNHSGKTLHDLSIRQTVPHNVRIVSATQGLHRDAGAWDWHLHDLLPDETRRLVLLVQPIAEGSARFVSRGILRAAVRSETRVDVHQIALNMMVPDQVHPGKLASLRFEFANTGTTRPRELMLRLHLPPQLDHALGRTLDLEIEELLSGSRQNAQLHVRAGQKLAPAVCKAALMDGDQVITSTTATIQIVPPAQADRQ